jgi:hypothetical protein
MSYIESKKTVMSFLRADSRDSDLIKQQIQVLDRKVQKMLLWSNIIALCGYLIVMFTIIRYYMGVKGTHPMLLCCCLALILLLFGAFLFTTWKTMAYGNKKVRSATQTYLQYQIGKLKGQRKLLTSYVLSNFFLIVISSVFFCLDVKNGITTLLNISAPISLLTYIGSLYFISKFSAQQRKIETLEANVENIYRIDKITQN